MGSINESITISGLRKLVEKKSNGEKLSDRDIALIEKFMMRLHSVVSIQHTNCCNECVTKVVWNEAKISYRYLIGESYER